MKNELTVTWIAPEVPGLQPLAFLSELGQIAKIDGVGLNIVAGTQITRSDVARALRARCDVLLWSGHGRPGELVLPDGPVRAKWVAAQARAGVPRLVVLAACGSLLRDDGLKSMAEEVSRLGLNCVGFPLEANDAAAICFNVELVRAMAAGCAVGAAFDVALDEICNVATAAGVFLVPGLTNGYRDIVLRLEAVEQTGAETAGLGAPAARPCRDRSRETLERRCACGTPAISPAGARRWGGPGRDCGAVRSCLASTCRTRRPGRASTIHHAGRGGPPRPPPAAAK